MTKGKRRQKHKQLPTETRGEPYAPEREAVPALPMSPIVFILFIFWQHVCLKTILHFYILLN